MARSSLFPASVQPGKPILPLCPPGWTTVKFRDVLEIVERPVDLIDDVEYQLVTAKRSRGGVVARSRLLGRDVLTKTQFLIARDDFLMSNRQIIHGGCGIVPPALDGAVVSNEYSVLRPKSNLLLEFLGYLSHSIYFQQTCFHASVGVDVEKMIFDCEHWLEFRFHLPPLREQRRIAEILSSVDEAIAATRAVIEQTRKVKQGMLERLLTKGIGHTRFKQTETGEIPEGWRLCRVEDLLDRPPGKVRKLKTTDYLPSGKISIVDQGEKLICGFTNELDATVRSDTPLVAFGDHTRHLKFIDFPFAVGADGVQLLRPKPTLLPKYFYYALCGIPLPSRGYARHFKDLREWKIPVPPIDEQQKIILAIEAFDNSLAVNEGDLKARQLLKAALMSDLLTGRKRMTDTLPMAAE